MSFHDFSMCLSTSQRGQENTQEFFSCSFFDHEVLLSRRERAFCLSEHNDDKNAVGSELLLRTHSSLLLFIVCPSFDQLRFMVNLILSLVLIMTILNYIINDQLLQQFWDEPITYRDTGLLARSSVVLVL